MVWYAPLISSYLVVPQCFGGRIESCARDGNWKRLDIFSGMFGR